MTRVYIAYDHRDSGAARALAERLASKGFEVRRDPANLPPGPRWDDQIEQSLRNVDVFVACWSSRATQARWVDRIAFYGHLLGRLVNVQVDPELTREEMRRPFASQTLHDFFPKSPDHIERISKAIAEIAGRKPVLGERPIATDAQAGTSGRRAQDLLPGLLRDRPRFVPRETRFAGAVRELTRSAWSHVRFGIDHFAATPPDGDGSGVLGPLLMAVEQANDPAVWALYGDVVAPFEPAAAFAAYRKAGLPGAYVETLTPDTERRQIYRQAPSGRNRTQATGFVALATLVAILGASAALYVTRTAQPPEMIAAATVTSEAARTVTAESEAPSSPGGERKDSTPSEIRRLPLDSSELPVLPPVAPTPPAPEPPAAEPAAPDPVEARAPLETPPVIMDDAPQVQQVEESSDFGARAPLPPPATLAPTPLAGGALRLCRPAGPLAAGERAEEVAIDENMWQFSGRVAPGGAAQILERNRACLESRSILKPDGGVLSGWDLLFPRDVLVVPAGFDPPESYQTAAQANAAVASADALAENAAPSSAPARIETDLTPASDKPQETTTATERETP